MSSARAVREAMTRGVHRCDGERDGDDDAREWDPSIVPRDRSAREASRTSTDNPRPGAQLLRNAEESSRTPREATDEPGRVRGGRSWNPHYTFQRWR